MVGVDCYLLQEGLSIFLTHKSGDSNPPLTDFEIGMDNFLKSRKADLIRIDLSTIVCFDKVLAGRGRGRR